jgi:acyl-CoA reductase-like NAD-dependent aldehyde dehydrogenase
MPFAGRRESGYGTGGIPWTMQEMTAEKMIVISELPQIHTGTSH